MFRSSVFAPSIKFETARRSAVEINATKEDWNDDRIKTSPRARMRSTIVFPSFEATHVELVILDHRSGNLAGLDIIYSSLIYLIESATSTIDLVFGYLQLFPHLKVAIDAAIRRGVQIRLFTNSSDTNDVFFYAHLFNSAMEELLDMGAKVYIMDANFFPDDHISTAHYKYLTVDNKVVMLGSWNCGGTSIFFDSEVGMILFDTEETPGDLCRPFNEFIDENIANGMFVLLQEKPPPAPPLHPLSKFVLSKETLRNIQRGF